MNRVLLSVVLLCLTSVSMAGGSNTVLTVRPAQPSTSDNIVLSVQYPSGAYASGSAGHNIVNGVIYLRFNVELESIFLPPHPPVEVPIGRLRPGQYRVFVVSIYSGFPPGAVEMQGFAVTPLAVPAMGPTGILVLVLGLLAVAALGHRPNYAFKPTAGDAPTANRPHRPAAA